MKDKFKYEVVYILKPTFTDFANLEKKIKTFFPDDQISFKSLGKKRFSYPIKKEKEGHYYQFDVLTEGKRIKYFLEEIKWINEILRFLVINLDREKFFSYSQKKKPSPTVGRYNKIGNYNPNYVLVKGEKKNETNPSKDGVS